MQDERTLSHAFSISPKRVLQIFILLTFVSGGVLLLNDFPVSGVTLLAHGPVSAAPLILIGLAALSFQAIIRPGRQELFKALLVCAAFLLWGIDQLLPPDWLAVALGDIVIVLYVIDLGWMMLDRLKA